MAIKKNRGRQPFVPTKEQCGIVKGSAMWNVPIERIRQKIINPQTNKPLCFRAFKKAFSEELKFCSDDVEHVLRMKMLEFGMKEKGFQDRKFILACQFGWKEAQVFESDNSPTPTLTDEQEEELLRHSQEDLGKI